MPHKEVTLPHSLEPDVIDQLATLQPSSAIAALRAQRPEVMQQAQNSYNTLFAPTDFAGFTTLERTQVAFRVAIITRSPALTSHYRQQLLKLGATEGMIAEIEQFPNATQLSARSVAILRHVDLLTHEPAAATPAHLAALQVVGLSTRNIVTLSQLIAFLSFQVRTLVGLQLLKGTN